MLQLIKIVYIHRNNKSEKAASEACRYADLEKIQLLFKVMTKSPYPTASSVWMFVQKSTLFNCICFFFSLQAFFRLSI